MSITTTTNPTSRAVLEVLTDYDLHHSGDPQRSGPPEHPKPQARAPEPYNNPHWWPNDHRRIPPYRPVNRNLDRSQRPAGVNRIERAFIFTMLRGVQLEANISTLWRHTGGKLNDKIFRYDIGGER
ncbi:uncharacterized protein Z518_10884 [Rhinocladiella mackenziei CBS 650.93]|uniref:Rhinocladiella mackenziei CBS 650.93 unplaced genomic scaffold supercont1.10, whole genome shotgun sequence n=1 Tax=Rhinocladiella mackenziei CBS 650.93 TaxID=1442369 RepID=A0A0D2FCZ3_9EURO|nr:uncharacterized protein Z518_10884 [Rhinocladiella mackenziei CBS 650.93]KIW99956.1 hypothetical protein Z518_10884 [Rhinocladiella mackenziei CBS 650.93]